ncbi:MAG: hypothetical protein KDK65_04960 [Chlamydiia bacterium]|nr:hypothetical protein [Chlamydiia bacterium]
MSNFVNFNNDQSQSIERLKAQLHEARAELVVVKKWEGHTVTKKIDLGNQEKIEKYMRNNANRYQFALMRGDTLQPLQARSHVTPKSSDVEGIEAQDRIPLELFATTFDLAMTIILIDQLEDNREQERHAAERDRELDNDQPQVKHVTPQPAKEDPRRKMDPVDEGKMQTQQTIETSSEDPITEKAERFQDELEKEQEHTARAEEIQAARLERFNPQVNKDLIQE